MAATDRTPGELVAATRSMLADLRIAIADQASLGLTGISSRTPPQHGARETLGAVRASLGDCRRCPLAAGRQHIVFGTGHERARLLLVGEGPGREEDRTGEPFVGEAGRLLDRMLAAMGLARDEVYIANVVKCRPPNNRAPEPDEVAACLPFLERQILAIRPDVVVALGRSALEGLLHRPVKISRERGQFLPLPAPLAPLQVMPTFHPAYLLRNPGDKKLVWHDLQAVMARLGQPRAASPKA